MSDDVKISLNNHNVPRKMTEEEFVTQYVLNRALGNISGLCGEDCAIEGRKAYQWIQKFTSKVID